MNFKKIFYISKYTYIEIYKSKIMINIIVTGILLAFLCYVASSFSYGNPSKVALDIGLGLLSVTSKVLALFFGASLLRKEIESRTIYLILSNPISRTEFLVGKVLGLAGILALNILILSIFTLVFYYIWDGVWTNLILWGVLQIFMEGIMILLIVVTFSLITNINLSIFYTIGLYIAGSILNNILNTIYIKGNIALEYFVSFISFALPNFSRFDIKSFILYQQSISTKYLLATVGYGMTYSLFLLFISTYILNNKDLD